MAKPEYEHVGSVKRDVYRRKPQKESNWGGVIGFFIVAFILIAIFG